MQALAKDRAAFGRARCAACGHDFVLAFSCKGRGLCPSCNARRMVEVAAHMVDNVFPPLCQWVLSFPKRLRYFLRRDAELAGRVLQVFLRAVEAKLCAASPDPGLTVTRHVGREKLVKSAGCADRAKRACE